MSERIPVRIEETGAIRWDNAVMADQQARTLITILTAENAVMRKRMVQLEAELKSLHDAVVRQSEWLKLWFVS